MADPTAVRARLITPTFLLIGAATLAYFTSAGMTLPALPRYVAGPLAGDRGEVGLVVGLFSATALLFRPWAGRLGDRRGRRLIMVVGGALVGLSVVGYMLAQSVPQLLALRLVSGAGEAFFFTGAAVAIADLAPEERRGEAVSFFSLALYIGIGVGPFFGELLIDAAGFTPTWIVAGALSGVAGLMALLVPETRPEGAGQASSRLIHPAAILPGAALFAAVWGMAGYLTFLPLYATTVGFEGARYVFLLYSGIVVLIRSVGAKIPDRFGPERSSRAALAFCVLGMTAIAVWRSPPGLVVGTVLFGIGASLAFPALMLLALRGTDPAERGVVLGTFGAFVDLAFGLGPATLGYVAVALGYRGLFLTAAGVAACGLALVFSGRASAHRR